MNRNIETAQVSDELILSSKQMKKEQGKGKELSLNDDEKAFYDALMINDSAVKVLRNEMLWKIALRLTDTIRNNISIDWTKRENIQAKLRVKVKRILRKYGYPPDKQKKATYLLLDQAHVICDDWVQKN